MEQVPVEGILSEAAFDVPPEHIVQSSRGKGWHGIDIAEIIHPLDDFALPAIPRHVLVVNLGSPTEVRERLVGRQGHLGQVASSFCPQEHQVPGIWSTGERRGTCISISSLPSSIRSRFRLASTPIRWS